MKRFEFIEKMSGIDPKYVSEAANYRPKRMVGIRVIAIAACLAMMLTTVTVWGLVAQDQAKQKSTFDMLSELAETQDGVFSVSKFNQREIFSDFSSENISNIMAAFDVVVAKNNVVELAKEPLICCLFNNNGISYMRDGDKILVNTDVDASLLKYAMYVSVYVVNFPETVYRVSDPRLNMNAYLGADICILFDYAEYGYDNAFDFVSAEYRLSDNTYKFCEDVDMYRIKDDSLDSPAPNLLSCINSGDSRRIQRFKESYIPKEDFSE